MHPAIGLLTHVDISMLNARVSALSSQSSFSTMLVHSIIQPPETLELGLYDLQGQIKNCQLALS